MTKKSEKIIRSVVLIFFGLAILVPDMGLAEVPDYLPGPGTIIPSFSLPVPKEKKHRTYLKVGDRGTWSPGNIHADVLLVEILSVSCATCRIQAPDLNKLYDKIESDPDLKDKVKIIGISAGDNRREVSRENEKYKYPLFPDNNYFVYDLVGAPFAPFFLFTRPDGDGGLFVLDSYFGSIIDADELLALVRKAKKANISASARKGPEWIAERPVLPISEDELMKKVRESLSIRDEEPYSIKKVSLLKFGEVYISSVGNKGKLAFAKVVARRVPCVDCHSIFFVYSFDDKGVFLNLVPIKITKAYNKQWNTYDLEKVKASFIGKSIEKKVPFDSSIDAVSSATISSKAVFDSMNKAHLVYEELEKTGYVTN